MLCYAYVNKWGVMTNSCTRQTRTPRKIQNSKHEVNPIKPICKTKIKWQDRAKGLSNKVQQNRTTFQAVYKQKMALLLTSSKKKSADQTERAKMAYVKIQLPYPKYQGTRFFTGKQIRSHPHMFSVICWGTIPHMKIFEKYMTSYYKT